MPEASDLVLNPEKTLTYRVCAKIVGSLAALFFHPVVEGANNIPLEGPVIVAPIHRSNVDFAFSLFISPRKVFFMAKEGVFHPKPFAELLTKLGAFPVNRATTDRESMRLSEEVLRRGQALVLFPEGTRKEGTSVGPLHDGAMFLAARTKAKIVPVGIAGSEKAMPKGAKFPRFTRIHVVVGAPIEPPSGEGRVSRSEVTAKTEELRKELEAVYGEARERLAR
ncbi:MAG TPA: lysophospholipid acyltransferase family protein [Acidimicrobiales bacterium]|jgi:1-acyl-sn-glycerol-3-phosphate acyltransferase|nr:lysophospholipid acyltransferase family protein [Acidimicrobiales bacterium]